MTNIATSADIAATTAAETDATRDFQSAVRSAVRSIQVALQDGAWTPRANEDIETLCKSLEARITSDTFALTAKDATRACDLCETALGAMRDGRWERVSRTDIAAIQTAAFLADFISAEPALFEI